MTPRERFNAIMNFETADRNPFVPYFGVWPATWERWKKEGLGDRHWTAPFDFDVSAAHAAQFAFVPVQKFVYPHYEEEDLKEEEGRQLVRDQFGVTKLVCLDGSGMTHYVSHPVTDRKSWEEFREERLNPHAPDRMPADWDHLVEEYNNRDYVLGIGGKPLGLFSVIREFMGAEPAFMSVALEPDWVREMAEYFADFWLEVYAKVLRQVQPDFFYIWELICNYKGSMISPEMFKDLFLPSYKRLIGGVKAMGVKNVWVDCQGNCWEILPLFIEAGVTGTLPLEVRGGMDVRKVRKRYPRLQLIGGIERMALVRGKRDIDSELERVAPLVPQGGYMPTIDHSYSSDIPWKHFKYFVQGLKQISSVNICPENSPKYFF